MLCDKRMKKRGIARFIVNTIGEGGFKSRGRLLDVVGVGLFFSAREIESEGGTSVFAKRKFSKTV